MSHDTAGLLRSIASLDDPSSFVVDHSSVASPKKACHRRSIARHDHATPAFTPTMTGRAGQLGEALRAEEATMQLDPDTAAHLAQQPRHTLPSVTAADFRGADLELQPDRLPPDALIVDIREPYERQAGWLPASVHVPIDEVAEWVVHAGPRQPVVFVCLGGLRAAMIARACVSIGLDARYLAGGMRGWVAAGHSLEPESGWLADHGQGDDKVRGPG